MSNEHNEAQRPSPEEEHRTPTNRGSTGSKKAPTGLEPVWRYFFWWLLLMALLFYVLSVSRSQQATQIPYSQFKEEVQAGEVADVTVRGQSVTGHYQAPKGAQEAEAFRTTRPPMDDPELLSLLEQHGVEMTAEETEATWWQQMIIGLLPWLLIIGLFVYGTRRLGAHMARGGPAGGLFGFAKSKAKRFHKAASRITFDDVAGLRSAKQDLREITAYLKDPMHYRKLGAKIPKGILLMGPPGTGKTLLAKAVAGEAEVPFFSISGSEFIEMFVGIGASRVRDMFESAKKEAPAIIFIDEIDSVGRARGAGLGGGHDEREQTLNQILGEMDGFAPHEAVVVLAATNRPDVLDAALLRPGRFDRKVMLDLPDKTARRAILDIHSRDVPLAEDVDLDRLAALTVGFSGADLENLVNEAALLVGREHRQRVDMPALTAARDRIVLGATREMFLSEEEKKLIAYHEAGHAIAALVLPHADPLDRVTIVPRGRALGATEQIPEEDRHNLRQSYVRDRIGVMLGGRIAERLFFGEVSSGSAEDLKQATRLARLMVSHWGMSDRVGPVTFRFGEEHVFLGREIAQQKDFSEATAERIDDELTQLTREIEEEVAERLAQRRHDVEKLAETLLEKETLEADEIRALVDTSEQRLTGTR